MNENLVWYASYGSNILYERFMCYIEGGTFAINNRKYDGCTDHSKPLDMKTIIIPYQLYFGNKSGSWDDCGVAFLDIKKAGMTLGRMYLITEQQFNEVHKQEGKGINWYNEVVTLGEYNGYEIKTFTNSSRRDEKAPSDKYLKVVKMGLEEAYSEMIIL